MGTNSKSPSPRLRHRYENWSRRKRWLFRLTAVACGLAPLLLAEWILAALGWADPRLDEDPYVGFRQTRSLFVLDQTNQQYLIPESRHNWFCPESFAATKPANEFRIFCLGGSTVQGRPFAKDTAFSTWLERDLAVADSTRTWRVINCGGVSYASYRLALILAEILTYSPDLIVLYTGHNEFLEDRNYTHIRDRSAISRGLENLGERSRLVTLFRRATRGWFETDTEDRRTQLESDVNAWLDGPNGLEQYHRNHQWQTRVVEHFEFNLRRMIAMCQARGVRIVLVNPVSNLRDSPPFKAQHRDNITESERAEWNELVEQGRDAYSADLWKASALFQKAREIDGEHAGLLYKLAKCYDRTGRHDQAREAYIAAKDQDICSLRMLESMHAVVLETARRSNVACYDARAAFQSLSPNGIVGNFLMLDHVHPSVKGHQRIAEGLVELLALHKIVKPVNDWRSRAEAGYSAHLESLDRAYFLQGLARLEGLQRWARRRQNIFDDRTVKPQAPGHQPASR